MRVSILGGAFDPIHNGHIELARFVLDNCPVMDEVWIMPCYDHPFGKKMADYESRYHMCKLATSGYQKIKVSKFEYEYDCSSSYDMLKKFEKHNPLITPYMTVGMDEANQINKWGRYLKLIKEFTFIVVDRGRELPIEDAWFDKKPHIHLHDRYSIISNISSTDVRSFVPVKEQKIHLKHMINHNVFEYIKENKLYE